MTPLTTATADPVRLPDLSGRSLPFYSDEGYLLMKGLLTPDYAAALKAEVMDIMSVVGLGVTKLRQSHEYLRGSALDTFVNSPHLLEIAAMLMGGPSSLYLPFTAVKSRAKLGVGSSTSTKIISTRALTGQVSTYGSRCRP